MLSLTDVVLGDERHRLGLLTYGYDLLQELGLVREDREGDPFEVSPQAGPAFSSHSNRHA